MPSYAKNVKHLTTLVPHAPKAQRDKINDIIRLYQEKRIPSFLTAKKNVVQLSHPSLFKHAERDYKLAVAKYSQAQPIEGRLRRQIENARKRHSPEKDYRLTVLLFTSERKKDPETPAVNTLTPAQNDQFSKALKHTKKKFKGYEQFWKGQLSVRTAASAVMARSDKQMLTRQSKDWKPFYDACMTDADFANRERVAPGYLEAIFVLDATYFPDTVAANPAHAPMLSGEKIAVHYKYCSTTLDLTRDTFREAIQKEHYVRNECWINAIYEHYGETLLNPNKKRNRIDRQTILADIGMSEESIKDGITIKQILPFFVKYKLKLRVLDKFYRLVERYDPEVPNWNNKPLYCMTDGDHIYTLNHDLNRLAQKIDDGESDEYYVYASQDFRVFDKRTPVEHRMIDNIDDIIRILRDIPEAEDREIVYLVHRYDDLEEVVWQLREGSYEPKILYEAGKISRVSLELNNRIFIIKSQQLITSEIDGQVMVDTAETYNRMNAAMTRFYDRVFRNDHKSYYTKQDIDFLDEYRSVANVGLLAPIRPKVMLQEIDVSKAYTAAFVRICAIPVFNEFDAFRPYTNQKITNLGLYIVKSTSPNLFFNKAINLCYGQFLKHFMSKEPKNIQILAYKLPSFIRKVQYGEIVKELWNTPISPQNPDEDKIVKKMIANVNFGIMEKGVCRNQKSFIFSTYTQAKFYQQQYGGTINYIKEYEERTESRIDPLDKDIAIEDPGDLIHTDLVETGSIMWILNISASACMNNGFRFVKELLLQHHNFFMYESHEKLKSAGVQVHSVKTDAFVIRQDQLELTQELLGFHGGIGEWHVARSHQELTLPHGAWECRVAHDLAISVPISNHIPLTRQEEYNVDLLCEHFERLRRVMVRAEFAGCGKSYTCRRMEQRGHRVLFVGPTNQLVSNYGEHGTTMNKFFSVGLSSDSKLAKFDDSAYDTIVFDEILCNSVRMLARIKHYCDAHPDKIIIGTGDTDQLEPIECVSNTQSYDEYANMCVDSIFPNLMFLTENKRLKLQADKDRLKQLKSDLRNPAIPRCTTIRKYFALTKTIGTTQNIAYKNKTCQRVSVQVRKQLNKKADYERGETLICRKYFRYNKITYNVNYEYKITKIVQGGVVLDNDSILPPHLLQQNFIHGYCRTCHSMQGSSIDDRITIFDWQYRHVSWKWLYTAITRATYFQNVQFFDYQEEPEDDRLLQSYLQMKVRRYREQDARGGWPIEPATYITTQWLQSCFGKSCNRCGDCLTYEIENNRVSSNLSAQRLDNFMCHDIENIVPFCVYCNASMSNRGA